VAVGTSVPEHRIEQVEARVVAERLFGATPDRKDLIEKIFDNAQVRTRYSAAPPTWFTAPHPFSEKNALFRDSARRLCANAIRACLSSAGLETRDIDHLVVVTTTGVATPSLDALLINDLALRRDVVRTPIWGLGCAGGIGGLARAADFAVARPKSRIVVVAFEACTLTFLAEDESRQNLIAMSLFGDGAAAVLVAGDQAGLPGPSIVAHTGITWPDTLDVMGWEFVEKGFKVVLSKAIPVIVRNHIRGMTDDFLNNNGLDRTAVEHYITHPGGPRVIEAYREALGLSEEQVGHTRTVLREYGNMSSPTVLFIMKRFMDQLKDAGDAFGLASAMGPGFSAEMLLLRWPQ